MINGDDINGLGKKLYYFFQSLQYHRIGNPSNIVTNSIKLSLRNVETENKSPSRILCDAFWASINYSNLSDQLKSKLYFLDLGCGDGMYGKFIQKLSENNFGSYTGLDIYKDKKFPTIYGHVMDKAENAHIYIKSKTNIIISQSALEHIEGDLQTLKSITNKLIENENPFVQIHLMPASSSLWTYLWHGWRQYSKNNLGLISETLEKKFSTIQIAFPIGGNSSFWVHLKKITIPSLVRSIIFRQKKWRWTQQPNINNIILNATLNDLYVSDKLPTFWALCIMSKDISLKFK